MADLSPAQFEILNVRSHGVRLRPNVLGRLQGVSRGLEELRKLPLSAAARWTLRGESIAIPARRPFQEARGRALPIQAVGTV